MQDSITHGAPHQIVVFYGLFLPPNRKKTLLLSSYWIFLMFPCIEATSVWFRLHDYSSPSFNSL